MLEALAVSRRFGWRWALREVDISVERGRPLALLGANGSGKTTLLKAVAGLVRPTGGEIRLDGEPIAAGRGRIGLLSHDAYLYAALTLRENLRFFAKLFRLPAPRAEERIGELAETLNLAARLDEPVRALSQGLLQRAALARALLHDPAVLLLDEPFAGLDPEAAERLEGIIRSLCLPEGGVEGGGGRILLLTSHDVGRARSLCEEVAVLSAGRVALRAPARSLSDADILHALRREGRGGGGKGKAQGDETEGGAA